MVELLYNCIYSSPNELVPYRSRLCMCRTGSQSRRAVTLLEVSMRSGMRVKRVMHRR
jgi:hypothetical protein